MTKTSTDWGAIRTLMNAAIDACERVDRLSIDEDERSAIAWRTKDMEVSVSDFLMSAWTYPENVELELVRLRHRLEADATHVDPLGRALVHAAKAAAQLIGARAIMKKRDGHHSLASLTGDLSAWYTHHFAPRLVTGVRKARARA